MGARKYGVILRPLGDTVVIMPPLSVTRDQIDVLVDVLDRCIIEITGE
jgi:adenosylmethionine-8-amino-7-oxononanoate aminotransferase